MRVLIAPDCFGDSLTAVEAARAMAAGWRSRRPSDIVVLAPQSDGGPGFVDVLLAADAGLRERRSRVSGPLDRPVEARWCYRPEGAATFGAEGAVTLGAEGAAAYLECAQACGLALLDGPPTPQTAIAAHSRGVGDLMAEALGAGARTIVVGLGGSCCTDGGRGLVTALGGMARARRLLADVVLVAATDVEHGLLGPAGSAAVFGPQKGADPKTVEFLEQRLSRWADELDSAAGYAVRDVPGAGAAGGIGAALLALGAVRQSGADVIAEHTGLDAMIAAADLVLTGEGRLDEQSLHGKVVGSLARRARAAGVELRVLAGQITLGPTSMRAAGIAGAASVADHAGSVRRAIDEARDQLEDLAACTAAGLGAD